MRVREVDKSLFKNYLKKAEECLLTAESCLESGRWNAAVINAVHCGISACDALTVFGIGVRHAGERHLDAVTLLQRLGLPKDVLRRKSRQTSRLLGIKNVAEYEDRLMDEKEAIEAIKNAKRFFTWAKEHLKP